MPIQMSDCFHKFFLTMFLILFAFNSKLRAEQCNISETHFGNVAEVYSVSNFCNWFVNKFIGSGECSGKITSSFSDNDFQIMVYPIKTRVSGYLEVEASIVGPGRALSGKFITGCERHVVRIMVFYLSSCSEEPYLYLRLALGNPRDCESLRQADQDGGNTSLFDPNEGWRSGIKQSLYEAIQAGVDKVIRERWGGAK